MTERTTPFTIEQRDGFYPAPAMPTYPTKKGLHLIRRMTMRMQEVPIGPLLCPRCERPQEECQVDEWGDNKSIIECRDTEIELLKRRVAELELELQRADG